MGDALFDRVNGILERLLQERQPEYVQAYRHVMTGYGFYRCNMFVMRREILDAYCTWLFSFIIDAVDQADLAALDAYQQRAVGFFAERMLSVWLMQQRLKIKELPILEMR